MKTRFTELVGCAVPLQQAPMGPVSGSPLVVAAVAAGAAGTVALSGYPVEAIVSSLDALNTLTSGPYGGNFVVPFIEDTAVITECARRCRFVDFYHAKPDPTLVALAHQGGALACWQIGSVEDARAAVDCGVDFIAVRGIEGGGRMHGDRALWPLLCDVLDAVGDALPVLAAGGIGTGRGLAAALAAGADGARIGTVLAATHESGAHPVYKQALIGAGAADSVLTDEFSNGWPSAPYSSRVLRQCIAAAKASRDEVVGHAKRGASSQPVLRFGISPPSTDFSGQIDAMPLYAGESVTFVRSIRPARDVILEIVEDARRLLSSAAREARV